MSIAPGVFPHADDRMITHQQKAALDALHLRKIDPADRVLVVNPGGDVGIAARRRSPHVTAACAGALIPVSHPRRTAAASAGVPSTP